MKKPGHGNSNRTRRVGVVIDIGRHARHTPRRFEVVHPLGAGVGCVDPVDSSRSIRGAVRQTLLALAAFEQFDDRWRQSKPLLRTGHDGTHRRLSKLTADSQRLGGRSAARIARRTFHVRDPLAVLDVRDRPHPTSILHAQHAIVTLRAHGHTDAQDESEFQRPTSNSQLPNNMTLGSWRLRSWELDVRSPLAVLTVTLPVVCVAARAAGALLRWRSGAARAQVELGAISAHQLHEGHALSLSTPGSR